MGNEASDRSNTAGIDQHKAKSIQEAANLSLKDIASLSPEQLQRLLQDMLEYQANLEKQNEELHKTREKLIVSQALYANLYDSAPVGYVTVSEKGLIREANLTAATLLGMPRNTLAQQPLIRFVFREDQEIFSVHCRQLFETGNPQECELRLVKADSKQFWGHLAGTISHDSQGALFGHIIISDIAHRKQTEAELLILKESLENSFDAIGMTNPEGIHYYQNKAFDEMFATIGKRPAEVYVDKSVAEDVFKTIMPGGKWTGEIQMYDKDGNIRDVLLRAYANKDDKGNITALVGIHTDITERKKTEKAMLEMNRQLEMANQAKSRFLTNMSHEIRTPLNAIIGFAQILERDASLVDKHAEQVSAIIRSGEHLLTLFNEILDVSRIEAGRIELQPNEFNLHDMLEDLNIMFQFTAGAKGLQFSIEGADQMPRMVKADAAKLRQVFINLIGNAIKFTSKGAVIVRVHTDTRENGDSEDAIWLKVEVEDSGPGIRQEEITHIFDSFWQSESGIQAEGAGLGLAICQRLVRLMGGDITVESQFGKGSCFRFEVPLAPTNNNTPTPTSEDNPVIVQEPATSRKRVLIVDDTQDMRELLLALLEPEGYEFEEAENGQQAIELFEKWAPDIILMDMRMPVMNGDEAVRKIKATEKGQNTPVIIVTAAAFAEDIKKATEAGADAYLSKPFKMKEVTSMLRDMLQ